MTSTSETPEAAENGGAMPRWAWIAIAVAVVGVLAVVWFLRPGPTVEVPDVSSLTQAEATKALQDAGLLLGEVSEEATEAAAGTVIGQSPAAGTEADEGSSVDLVISSGPAMTAVPALKGLNRDEAEAALEEAGLEGVFTAEYDDYVEKDSVIDQLPAEGEKVAPGASVGVLLSLGERPEAAIAVPDVSGKTRAEARDALNEAGLDGYFVTAPNATVPTDTVVEQTPVAGVKVAPGTEVLVLVSTGPPPPTTVTVPNVVGSQGSAAQATLRNRGLSGRGVRTYSNRPAGEVISQEPAGGARVAEGTVVGLLVSAGPAPSAPPANPPTYPKPPTQTPKPPKPPLIETVEVPSVLGLTEEEAVAKLLDAGLEAIVVPYAKEEVPEGQVINQLPDAGARVTKGYSVMITVSTGPPADISNDIPAADEDGE